MEIPIPEEWAENANNDLLAEQIRPRLTGASCDDVSM